MIHLTSYKTEGQNKSLNLTIWNGLKNRSAPSGRHLLILNLKKYYWSLRYWSKQEAVCLLSIASEATIKKKLLMRFQLAVFVEIIFTTGTADFLQAAGILSNAIRRASPTHDTSLASFQFWSCLLFALFAKSFVRLSICRWQFDVLYLCEFAREE